MWVDSHAHLTDLAFVGEVDEVVNRASEAEVGWIVNICTDRDALDRGLAVANDHYQVVNVAATPPHTVGQLGEVDFPVMEAAARNGHLVAIGEIGLDYFYELSPREVQHDFLRRYLSLARELNLPVVIHCRFAFKDFFEILDKEFSDLMGVLHCFTGTLEEAREVISRGWMLSLSGIVTFKKSDELRDVAKWVPLDHLMIETDSPYLAPQSHRGKRNEPAYLPEIGGLIADLKGVSVEQIALHTSSNAKRLFRL